MLDNDLYSMFGVKKYPKEINEKKNNEEFIGEFRLKESNIEKLIIKVNGKIDLVSNPEIIFDENYKYDKIKMQEMFYQLKSKYDLILIDTCNDSKFEQLREILIELSNKVVFVTEGNILQLKKSIKILKKIKEKAKIKIIYNKKDHYTISVAMLKLIFIRIKLIGVIQYRNQYNKIINKGIRNTTLDNKIKKEFSEEDVF